MENGRLMSRDEVKTYLGIGETTLCKMVKLGHLPSPIYLGRKTLWFRESIEKTLSLLKIKSEANLRIPAK